MKRFLSWFLGLLTCFGLVFVILFTSLYLCLHDNGWFETELMRLDTARKSGHYLSELTDTLDTVRGRLAGNDSDSDDLSNKELSLLDALSKPLWGINIAFYAFLAVTALFFLTVPFAMRREWPGIFSRCFIISACIWFLPIAAFIIAINADFGYFLGLAGRVLAPGIRLGSGSLLGQLFSETLLFDLLMRGMKLSLIILSLLLALSIAFLVIRNRRRRSLILHSERSIEEPERSR